MLWYRHGYSTMQLAEVAMANRTTRLVGLMCWVVVASYAYPSGAQQSKRQERERIIDEKVSQVVASIDFQTDPFDLLILRDGTMHECRLLEPRPLKDLRMVDRLEVRLLDEGAERFEVIWRDVAKVVYFEDMLLLRSQGLVVEKKYTNAFRYLMRAAEMSPEWNGLEDQIQLQAFEESQFLLTRGRRRESMNRLAALRNRNPQYAGMEALYGEAADKLLQYHWDHQDYRAGRWHLRLVRLQFPDHAVRLHWTQRFFNHAQKLLSQARLQEQQGHVEQASQLAFQAMQVWPKLPNLQNEVDRMFGRFARIRVAVQEVPQESRAWSAADSQRRVNRLLYESLIDYPEEPESEIFRPGLADHFQMDDLGRKMTFELPESYFWSDLKNQFTAMDVIYALTRRADTRFPEYDISWSRAMQRVWSDSPFRVMVEFRHAPLRPEAFFTFALTPQYQAQGQRRPQVSMSERSVAGTGPFVVARKNISEEVFVSRVSDQKTIRFQIREIAEQTYPNAADALRAAVRGHATLVEHVPPFELPKVRAFSPWLVARRYAVPRVHFLALDFRNPVMGNRSLRRALVYAVNRFSILEDDLLEEEPVESDRVLSGPFRYESYAADTSITPHPYDPLAARVLLEKVKVELGRELPSFRIHCPPDDVARRACNRIAMYFQRVGLEMEIVDSEHRGAGIVPRSGDSLDLFYRISNVREPLLDTFSIFSLSSMSTQRDGPENRGSADDRLSSPWLERLLVQLSEATDLPTARGVLHQIHREVHDSLMIIPLWQIRDYCVFNRQLTGVPETLLDLYQGIDSWRFQPSVSMFYVDD